MIFSARIKRASTVATHWTEQRLRRGTLCGVEFERLDSGDYVSRSPNLTADEVAALCRNPCVTIETVTHSTVLGFDDVSEDKSSPYFADPPEATIVTNVLASEANGYSFNAPKPAMTQPISRDERRAAIREERRKRLS